MDVDGKRGNTMKWGRVGKGGPGKEAEVEENMFIARRCQACDGRSKNVREGKNGERKLMAV